MAVFLAAWWAIFAVVHCGYVEYRVMVEPLVIAALVAGLGHIVAALVRRKRVRDYASQPLR